MDYKEMQAAVEAGKRAGLIKFAEKLAATPIPEPKPVRIPESSESKTARYLAEELERTALARYRKKLEADIVRMEAEINALYASFGREVMAMTSLDEQGITPPLTSVTGEK